MKLGRGKLLALFIVPPLVIVLMILGIWLGITLQSDTEDGKQPTGGAHLNDPTNR
jgi:hypothetical protein